MRPPAPTRARWESRPSNSLPDLVYVRTRIRRPSRFGLGRPAVRRRHRVRPQRRCRCNGYGGGCSLTNSEHSSNAERRAELLALARELRLELHRYFARLMGAVIEGEGVVQDTLSKAVVALDGLARKPPLPAWLFLIGPNPALDVFCSKTL